MHAPRSRSIRADPPLGRPTSAALTHDTIDVHSRPPATIAGGTATLLLPAPRLCAAGSVALRHPAPTVRFAWKAKGLSAARALAGHGHQVAPHVHDRMLDVSGDTEARRPSAVPSAAVVKRAVERVEDKARHMAQLWMARPYRAFNPVDVPCVRHEIRDDPSADDHDDHQAEHETQLQDSRCRLRVARVQQLGTGLHALSSPQHGVAGPLFVRSGVAVAYGRRSGGSRGVCIASRKLRCSPAASRLCDHGPRL
jgi:hypothetical protein